jgi:urease accessory protein
MNSGSLLQGLRFIDSFFPSGGYAYSFGLEAAVQGGAVTNAADLRLYLEDTFRHGTGRREAVACGLAHDALVRRDSATALRTDAELDAMHPARESRLGSRQMGRQIIRTAAGQFDDAVLRAYAGAVDGARTPGHAPVALGLALAAAGWAKEDAIAALMYQTAVGHVSAALKLLPIGQHEGQSLLARWSEMLVHLSSEAAGRAVMQSWTPVQDAYAMRHGRLTTRLFRS